MAQKIFQYLQAGATVLALILNSFLIYIISKHTKSAIGSYKWLLIIFAGFEMTYAVVVIVGMPINFIAERSWINFNHDGIIGRASFNWLGPAIYCSFYEVWIGLVTVHFIYRYIAVCKTDWKMKIENSWKWKIFLALVYIVHFIGCFVCGIYFCTRNIISPALTQKIHDVFEINDTNSIGYILLRLKDETGQWSPGGIASIMTHYVLVLVSVVIIAFTGSNIWLTIRKMQRDIVHIRNAHLQHQMFITLMIQTTIPFFLVHLPSLVYLVGTSPFMAEDFTFGSISSMFSFLTAIPKVLDPIVVMTCIRDYRVGTLKVLKIERRTESRVFGTIDSKTPAHDDFEASH